MTRFITATAIAALLATGATASAAPKGKRHGKKAATQTVTCADGSSYTGKHPAKGCKAHGGVKK